jgi:hypothetical protein
MGEILGAYKLNGSQVVLVEDKLDGQKGYGVKITFNGMLEDHLWSMNLELAETYFKQEIIRMMRDDAEG